MNPMISRENNRLCFYVIFLLAASCMVEVFSADVRDNPETLLLKDFHPRSIYNVPRTNVKKARYAYKWRLDNQPGIVGHEGMVEILGRTVNRHPRTIFVACHFANCSDDLGRLGNLFDKYPNLYADISARYSETAAIPRLPGRFYEKYQDRLVYATDMRFGTEMYKHTFRILESADEHFYAWERTSYHWPLYGLDLSDRVLRKVYIENALKIIGNKQFGTAIAAPKMAAP